MSGLGVARVCLGVPGGVRRGRRWEERGNRGVETRAAPRASQIGVVTRAIFLRPRHRVAGGRVWRRVHASSVSSDAASTADTEDPKEPEKKPLPFRVPAKPPSLLVVPASPIPTIEEVLTETETKNVFSFLARKKKPKPPTGVRARDVITETVRLTFRDFAATVVLAVCAGAAAQVVNLGGTFLLAIAGVHEVDIVAAAFLLAVQLAKQVAQISVRVATFRNARDVDCADVTSDGGGVITSASRMNPKNAWREIVDAFAVWKFVLFIDARRLLSIAWNGVLTIPVPYLGLVKLLDYALCVPVFLFEGLQGKENLKRSETLMLGHRMRLLRAGLGLGTVLSLAVGVVVGTFSVIVPSLPSLLMEPATSAAATATAAGVSGTVSSGMDTNRASETAMGIFTGTAFDRVWDVGTITEKWATVFLLAFAVVGSFLFAAAVRQLVYVFYRETAARYAPPPPPDEVVDGGEPGPVKKFLAKMAFWKKVEDGDTSDAVATRTAELREKESSGGDTDFAKEKGS